MDAQADALTKLLAEMATKEDLEQLKADLTWRIFGAMGLFAALVGLLDAVID